MLSSLYIALETNKRLPPLLLPMLPPPPLPLDKDSRELFVVSRGLLLLLLFVWSLLLLAHIFFFEKKCEREKNM